MRIPSSLNSTDARSSPGCLGDAGRRGGEHRQDRAEEFEPDLAQPAPPRRGDLGRVRVRSPESISARRAISPAPAAFATASAITPPKAPWRSSPVTSRLRKSASGSVARPSSSARICLRRSPIRSRRRPDLRDRAIQIRDVSDGSLAGTARGRRRSRSRRRRAPPRNSGEEADGDRDLLRVERSATGRRGSRPWPTAPSLRRPRRGRGDWRGATSSTKPPATRRGESCERRGSCR